MDLPAPSSGSCRQEKECRGSKASPRPSSPLDQAAGLLRDVVREAARVSASGCPAGATASGRSWKNDPAPPRNPCRGLKRYTENKVERFLSTDELSRLGEALAAAERGELMISEVKEMSPGAKRRRGGQWKTGPRSESPSAIAAIRLLLFTGCRVGEILGLQWTHVHLDRKLLLLPDSKTGAKAVYLSEAAVRCSLPSNGFPIEITSSLARAPASRYCRFVGRGFICVQPRTSNICDCMTSGTALPASEPPADLACQ